MPIANQDEYELHHVLQDDSGNTYEQHQVSEPFFVLLDIASDPHARAALAAYAESCAGADPQQAAELRRALEGFPRPHSCNTPYGPTCWCEQIAPQPT